MDGKVRDLLVHVVRRINGVSLSHCAEDQIRLSLQIIGMTHLGFFYGNALGRAEGAEKEEQERGCSCIVPKI